MIDMDNVDPSHLPLEIRSRLAELELELSEGDITEKGYLKKKAKLLAPFLDSIIEENQPPSVPLHQPSSSSDRHIPCGAVLLPGLTGNALENRLTVARPSSPDDESSDSDDDNQADADRHGKPTCLPSHRCIREDSRFRSDTREEAVREALIQNQSQRMEALLPNKRVSMKNARNDSEGDFSVESLPHITAEMSFDSSHIPMVDECSPSQQYDGCQTPLNRVTTRARTNGLNSYDQVHDPSSDQFFSQPPFPSIVISAADSFEHLAAEAAAQLGFQSPFESDFSPPPLAFCPKSDSSVQFSPGWSSHLPHQATTAPAMYSNMPKNLESPHRKGVFGGVSVLPSSVSRLTDASSETRPTDQASDLESVDTSSIHACEPSPPQDSQVAHTVPVLQNRVSEKIQQLICTLKRPKRHPLPEYFLDDDDQVLMCPATDPSAPRPRGPPSQVIRGEDLVIPSGLPRNLESALQRYAGLSCKTPILTCLDITGRQTQVLTYAKLLNRSMRIAYTLLNKLGHRGEQSLRPREHVALVYPNNEPISFFTAFYGCILASVVPVAVEVPSTRKDSSNQSMGFVLSSQNVRVALTSEQCYKALPRSPNGDIATNRWWPPVLWVNTDHLGSGCKPPKDWVPPDRPPNEESLYTEYTFTKDGSVHAVVVSRRAALAHCRVLTVACDYSEEDVLVCVVDCRREIGLWHAVLSSVFNGLHVIFVPYSVMQVDPGSWLRMVTKYRASVAIVKSRDMYWALLAERDHSNTNLSSLRMLLVADGSNPWSLNSCDSFAQKFSSRGLRPEVICPASGSSETLTLSLRRPPRNPYHGCPTANGKVDSVNGSQAISTTRSATSSGQVRGIISIHSLTYGVVQVDSEDSLTSLTLQDCGHVLPGASAIVVRLGPKPTLCRTDELGEICLSSDYTGSGFWGLRGQSDSHFNIVPLNEDGSPVHPPGTITYTRSGFLGFPGPVSNGSLIFICGSLTGLMTIAGRRHNADDIIATVLAVQPTRIIYRCRIAVFSVELLKDERLVIVAELRHGFSDEAAFSWMSLVLQAVDSIHQVSVYCLALVPQNSLPRTPFGGINYNVTKRLFADGRLHPTALLLCPHSAIQNLPQPRQPRPSLVGPSAIMCGQVIQGARMAEAHGRPLPANPAPITGPPNVPEDRVQLLTEVLVWRASHNPDDRLFTVYNQKGQECVILTCMQLLRRADKLGCFLLDKAKASVGTVVALVYPPGVEMVCAFYACLLIGAIPVPIRPPRPEPPADYYMTGTAAHPVQSSLSHLAGPPGSGSSAGLGLFNHSGSTQSSSDSWTDINIRPHAQSLEASLELMWNVIKHSNASVILTQQSIIKLLKSKDATTRIPFSNWPLILDSEENFRRKTTALHQSLCTEQPVAYMDFAASTTGMLTGIRVTHQMVQALCQTQKVQCEFYPTREVVLSLDPYSGLAFTLWALTSVYCGHHSILIPPSVTEIVPDLWLSVCSQRKVRDAFCSNYTMELATQYVTKHISVFKPRDFSLSNLRSLVVVAEERPSVPLTAMFTKLFSAFGLMSRAVSTSFGCRANVAISLQGASSPESTTVYVDRISLRNDRVKLLEKGSPHSQCLLESGKLLPGVHIAIANPDTLGQCADSQLGEIWVSSLHNSTELLGPFGNASLTRPSGIPSQPIVGSNTADMLCAKLVTGDTERVFARTGFLGFVRRTDLTQSDGELHDAVFVVGSLEEAIMLRGMRYHPVDIENTVMRAHKQVCECAVFTWSNLLVVVAELIGEENEAMDLVHPITARVLEEHQLIVGVVVVTDPGTVPVNSCGEKQRILLRDSFVNDKLDPIYVSYNM